MINIAYGLLNNGRLQEGDTGFRYSDAVRPACTSQKLSELTDGISDDCLGAFIELLLCIMRSSPKWSTYIRKYDPINTYQIDLHIGGTPLAQTPVSFDSLVKWADSVSLQSADFPRSIHDVPLDRLCSALFCVLSAEV